MSKILIIEDDYSVLEYLSDLLKMEGYAVHTASDGKQGIRISREIIPDLIICDIYMPGFNGYDVLKNLRENLVTRTIPFIFLTAKTQMEDLRKGMLLGADDYLPKPVSSELLFSTVKMRITKHKDISQKYKDEIEKTIYAIKNFDPTTGLPRISLLQEKLDSLTNEKNIQKIYLLIIQINHFQDTLDLFGRQKYPYLLKLIINQIKKVISPGYHLYYLEYNRFAILSEKKSEIKSIKETAKKLIQSITKPLHYKNSLFLLHINIGISCSINNNNDIQVVYSQAEFALNSAIIKGNNTFQFYNSLLRNKELDRLKFKTALNKAIDKKEFFMQYQPIVRISDEKVVGMEALIRWRNSELGLVSPALFIPVAEENSTINEVRFWTINSVCRQLAEWQKLDANIPRIAINLSGKVLEEDGFIHKIISIIEKTGVEPEMLDFELTESVLVENTDRTIQLLNELRNTGIRISIDDFGTGYSSLSYLKDLPFDIIKIDKSFISDIMYNDNSKTIVTNIISMAHGLGSIVIAEGVEKAEQLDFLRKHNCDEIQGYYFSKSVSAQDFSKNYL